MDDDVLRVDAVRVDYRGEGLSEAELAPTPWQQGRRWVDDAIARSQVRDDVPEPAALSVATVDGSGHPNVRTVLMRFFDERGPGFVTSTDSTKGVELAGNPAIAASLTWPAMFRAIRFRGVAEPLGREELTAYFGSRPWGSRISAWASHQSQPISGREGLEEAYDRYAARWPDRGNADDVPVPDTWGGYRIRCDEVEFWGGRRNRLHDRLVFTRVGAGSLADAAAWQVSRRQP
jgi:pyridoxamine 5'-phosphate oxidase